MIPFVRKLGYLLRRNRGNAEINDELEFHLEEEAEELEEAGLSQAEARRAARRELGNVALVREDARAIRTWTLLEQLLQDVRYSARMLAQNPVFTGLAALSLALGIGANTAIFSFADALLMRSLPVPDPASLAVLNWHVMGAKNISNSVVHTVSGYFHDDPKTGKTAPIFPWPAFEFLRGSAPGSANVFSDLFAYRPAGKLNIMVQNQAGIAAGEYVSGDYFQGLEVAPAAGRLITGDDDRAGAPGVVVLGYAFAQRRFGDAASAAGRLLRINNVPFTVIGIAPAQFFGVEPGTAPDFYLPMHADLLLNSGSESLSHQAREYLNEHYYWIEMMGRLRPGITPAQAQSALAPVFGRWVANTATNDIERRNLPEFLLKPGAAGLDNLRREYSRPLYLLLAMVGLILGIACANIASLLLARATARRREMAVRLSLGASRRRVIRQLLTESLLLAALGGAAGVAFAIWGIRILTAMLASGSEGLMLNPELNWHVLAAAAALTTITGLLFGMTPALQATRVNVMPALKEGRMGEQRYNPRLRFTLSQMLVASQMAISLLLLAGAGLFVRTLANLRSIDMGFEQKNILTFTLNARQAGHQDPEIISFYRNLQEQFGAIPGVRSATLANSRLLGDEAWGWPVVPIARQRPEKAPTGFGSGMAETATHVLATGPRFFATMRIPILAGREFDERDRPGSLPVAIVNEAWVKTNLDGRNPIGQTIMSYAPRAKTQPMEIVGVAKNARYDKLTGNFPAIVYMPFAQNRNVPVEEMTFFLRTAGDPLAYAGAIGRIVQQTDSRIPITDLSTEVAQIDSQMGRQILFARLCSVFAALALAIACVGLYGTTSYTVARRTGEIGIRIALGARRGNVVRMVLRDVVTLAVAGCAISVPVAWSAEKLVESFLFGLKPYDAGALAPALAVLLTAALLAGYAPAKKASRIDPIAAIRHE